MDFSHEFLMFQHGNHDTNEKIEFYQNFIMSLLEELKTIRETMCATCQKKCASSMATRSENQSSAISKDLTLGLRLPKLRHVIPTLPRMPKMNVFRRTRVPGSSSLAINETMASESSSLSTERRNETDNPIFSAEREASTDSTLDVTFVHSFRHNKLVHCVCLSRDGKYLAVGIGSDDKDGSIVIYEVESRKKYCELREYASQYRSYTRPRPWNLCFSPDGRYLAVVDLRIIIWDVPHKRIRSIFHRSDEFSGVRFSPDGRFVAFRNDDGLVVLNMRDNTRKMTSEGSCFDFYPGGRYIATGDRNFPGIRILDVRTGKAVKGWNADKYLDIVKFTSDGRGLLCVDSDMIEQWDMSDAVPVLLRKFNVKRYSSVYGTCFSPDHRLLAYANELWDVNIVKRQYILQGHNQSIVCFDFGAGGTYLAMGSYNGSVSLWRYNWE